MTLRRTMATVAIASVAVAPLSACQTTSLAQYADASDACYSYRKPLLETEENFNQNVAGGAVIGAVLGGLLGAAVGNGKGEAIAAGAAIGALAGGGAGYLKGKQDRLQSQQALLAEIDSDARNDGVRFSQTSGAISRLTNCRSEQIAAITDSYKKGVITQQQAQDRLRQVDTQIAQDKELLAKVLEGTGRRADLYIDAKAEALGSTRQDVLGDVAQVKAEDFLWNDPDADRSAVQPFVATKSANVRGAPSTSGAIVGSLVVGQGVTVQDGPSGGWYTIRFDDKTAYVYETLVAEADSAAANAAIASAKAPAPPKVVDGRGEMQIAAKVVEPEQVMEVKDDIQGVAMQGKKIEAQVLRHDLLGQQLAVANMVVGGAAEPGS